MKKKNLWTIIAVACIFLLGLALRVYRLDQNVPHLYADGTLGHYELLHLVQTPGRNIFDTTYRLLYYGPQTLTWLLGLTPLGARLPSAILGSLAIIVMFILSLKVSSGLSIKKYRFLALLAMLLMAISPWSIMISRISHSTIPIIVILISLHLILFLKAKNPKSYLLSLLPLILAAFYYSSMVIIVPLACLFTFYYFILTVSKEKRHKTIIFFVIILSLLSVFIFNRFGVFDPQRRGLDLAIWRDVNVTAESDRYRGLAPDNIATKIAFNYPEAVVGVFFRNYVSFFSPDFLFLKGDPVLRHSTGMVGEFFAVLAPFMIFGAFMFFSKASSKLKATFLFWILISPIPGAITKDGQGYLLRVITLMPFLTYFCAIGVVEIVSLIKSKVLKWGSIVAIGASIIYSAFYFFYGYFTVYPAISADSWEHGFSDVSHFNASHGNQTMLIVWENQYQVFCFWEKLPYEQCDSRTFKDLRIGNSVLHQSLSNLYTSRPENQADLVSIIKFSKPEYIAVPQKYLQFYQSTIEIQYKQVEIVKNPDGSTAFTIYELIK